MKLLYALFDIYPNKRLFYVCRRYLGTSKNFSETLNLPKTKFPLTMKNGAAAQRETRIQKVCEFDKLYHWQSSLKDRKVFCLHDGPPYANGKPHVGHVINKVLKDVTNRYKLLRGYRVEYVPGWDCHGLPIEQKALSDIKADHRTLDPLHIRRTAKKFAEKTIKTQMAAFKRWGVMADWSRCYYTFDKRYESQQLEVFFNMFNKGDIYEDFMPVYWSPSSRTALAEAELEYNDNHRSTAVYVKFPLTNLSEICSIGENTKSYVVIWTTTAWTLPANQAVCYGPSISYSLLKDMDSSTIYLITSNKVEEFSQIMQKNFKVLLEIPGSALNGLHYKHPMSNKTLDLLPANHVTVEKGTGLVHTAPSHGHDDFKVATHNSLEVVCFVDEDGCFTEEAGSQLEGLSVQGAGNDKVLELLGSHVLHREEFQHSYPYDWRTKQPVIIRASKQWFVNTAEIKTRALEILGDVPVIPKSANHGMLSQLGMRTYWCISRQRAWGVPIPVFYEKHSGSTLLTRTSVNHVRELVEKLGTDCWWELSMEELLPKKVIEASGFSTESEFVRGSDVLDIWFDSGTSWATVLKDCGGVADVYLEGLDQFGGWFQSSLLTSVAIQDSAPYRSLVTHGFAMDESGHKMSKSIGNVVDPDLVINGNKEQSGYGADVLRWWAAWAGLGSKAYIGSSILDQCNGQVFNIRKTLRYMLGNISDFESTETVAYRDLTATDKHMLHHLHKLGEQVTACYENFNYSKALSVLEKFINVQVSAYIHVTKDRAYCSGSEAVVRRCTQTVQWRLLEALTRYLAPVLPHLGEEVYQHTPHNLREYDEDSIFKTPWFESGPEWHDPELAVTFDVASNIKTTFYGLLDSEASGLFDVIICCQGQLFERLKTLQEEMTSTSSPLVETLQCASVSVISRPPLVIPDEATTVDGTCSITGPDGQHVTSDFLLVVLPSENFVCDRCRRYVAPRQDELCAQCTDVLADGWE